MPRQCGSNERQPYFYSSVVFSKKFADFRNQNFTTLFIPRYFWGFSKDARAGSCSDAGLHGGSVAVGINWGDPGRSPWNG